MAHRHTQVDAVEVEALLAELADVGGTVNSTAGQRPYSGAGRPRGTVGSTNILSEQRQQLQGRTPAAHRRSVQDGGDAASKQTPSSTVVGFSTYTASGLTEAEFRSQRLTTTPLGVRLAPLSAVPLQQLPGTPSTTSTPSHRTPHPPSKKGVSPSAMDHPSNEGNRQANNLPALPPLPGVQVDMDGVTPPSQPRRDFSFRRYGEFLKAEAEAKEAEAKEAEAKAANEADTVAAAPVGVVAAKPDPNQSSSREANFLPIMCARYLRPAGLIPTARWGHSLTPVTAETLLMFGGMELDSGATAALMVFSPSSISWEPMLVMSDSVENAPPAARHSHAACAYDSRYLIISGGVAPTGGHIFDDIFIFDLHTYRWRCIWDARRDGSPNNRNEPGPRFGHSMVVRDDRLYFYGGKTIKGPGGALSSASPGTSNSSSAGVLANGSDLYVFSLNNYRWKRRVRGGKERSGVNGRGSAATSPHKTDKPPVEATEAAPPSQPLCPARRGYHAACIKGDLLYINGGAAQSDVLTDTWCIHLRTGEWRCVHPGGSADAVPREKHSMFICGEALLLVGGCSTSSFNERVAGKYTNFAAVLPLVGVAVETPCWIPVAMGNISILAPNKKNFAAAFTGGFVYVFGGVSGAEPATNTMIRFLAADGAVSAEDTAQQASAAAQELRSMMQQLREQQSGAPYDLYAAAGVYGSQDGGGTADASAGTASASAAGSKSLTPGANRSVVGLHRAILQQRAPLLLQSLEQCRNEPYRGVLFNDASRRRGSGGGTLAPGAIPAGGGSDEGRDEVDQLLHQMNGGDEAGVGTSKKDDAANSNSSGAHILLYYTNGNSRMKGLPQSLAAETLNSLADYLYWGGLRSDFRLLLEESEDGKVEEGEEGAKASSSGVAREYRQQLNRTLQELQAAAKQYALQPLEDLCNGLLAGDRAKVQAARERSSAKLQQDMDDLLQHGNLANVTMLVVDPHTKQQSAHILHSSVLMAASTLFTELLRPLYNSGKSSNQIGPIAAKISAGAQAASSAALITSTSKRSILVGPVAIPLPAVQPILRFLYTQQLRVPSEVALVTLMGAHQLGLFQLQSYCEAVVAREEVNYDSCCSFYYLSKKYEAALLQEISLLTAVSGYSTVRYSPAYKTLSEEDKQSIDAVATELGSSSWVPPPQAGQEIKQPATYASRWSAAAPSM